MKSITVTVDDETYRRAEIKAAEQGTSLSELVKRFVTDLASGESEFEHLKRKEMEIRARIHGFDGGDRMSRDELHERGR